jgi:hypothetical protein
LPNILIIEKYRRGPFIMAGKRKTLGLVLGILGISILLTSIIPLGVLVVLEGAVLVAIGWLFFRNG